MYVPAAFATDDEDVHGCCRQHGAADLVTSTAEGLARDPAAVRARRRTPASTGRCSATSPATTRSGASPPAGEALVIVRGPDAYVSPSWYASKPEHGRVVPTWNYVTAHVYGRLVVHDDTAWVEALVRRLTEKHEAARRTRGRSTTPRRVRRRAAAGDRRPRARDHAGSRRRLKLSQNRPAADVDGVVAGLAARGHAEASAAVAAARAPGR